MAGNAGLAKKGHPTFSGFQLMREVRVPNKEGRPKAERPKSREETPKLGSDCGEACQRNHLRTMSCFVHRRNLYEYNLSTLDRGCIHPATTYVTNVYLVHHCGIPNYRLIVNGHKATT